ncbi:hypothetical protein NGUA03_00002 [Salmonella enterica]|nr:hypothetical protein NGUA03_00002 [Salmonella enterica]
MALHAANHRRFAFPEITVMNDDRIRLQAHRLVQQRLACGHACHDFMHRLFALNLQTVRRIVANGGAVQFVIDQLFQFGVFHHRPRCHKFCLPNQQHSLG